jgi:hypothetical protein
MAAAKFDDLESYSQERKVAWGDRDGYTPEQRCAIWLAVKGMRMELLMLSPKQTLRVLFRDGLIDYMGNGTKKAEEIALRWADEDHRKKECERRAKAIGGA